MAQAVSQWSSWCPKYRGESSSRTRGGAVVEVDEAGLLGAQQVKSALHIQRTDLKDRKPRQVWKNTHNTPAHARAYTQETWKNVILHVNSLRSNGLHPPF